MSMIEETIVLDGESDTFILYDEAETWVMSESSVAETIVMERVGIAMPGTPGEKGETGQTGPPGNSTESLSTEIDQIFPADPWVHYHNLIFDANGQFYDSTGQTKLEPVRTERITGGMKVYWSDNGSRPIAGKAFYS